MAQDFGITEDEAQVFIDKYFSAMPSVKRTIDECHTNIKKKGYCATMTGRKRRFTKEKEGYYNNKVFRQGFNHLIQGFSADMVRIAAIKVLNVSNKNPSWDLKQIFTVHDEIVLTIKEEYAEIAAKEVKRAMESCVKLRVPVIADVKIGSNYSEVK